MIARENGQGKRISMPYDHYLKSFLKVRAIAARAICDPPKEFDAKGGSTRTTRLHDTLSVP